MLLHCLSEPNSSWWAISCCNSWQSCSPFSLSYFPSEQVRSQICHYPLSQTHHSSSYLFHLYKLFLCFWELLATPEKTTIPLHPLVLCLDPLSLSSNIIDSLCCHLSQTVPHSLFHLLHAAQQLWSSRKAFPILQLGRICNEPTTHPGRIAAGAHSTHWRYYHTWDVQAWFMASLSSLPGMFKAKTSLLCLQNLCAHKTTWERLCRRAWTGVLEGCKEWSKWEGC